MTSEEYKAQLAEALSKLAGVHCVGEEYIRLVSDNAPIGGIDYLGQTVSRTMYADLWAYVQEKHPGKIITEEAWQAMHASQKGNVPYYSTGDGSTTFRMPKISGYFKGAGSLTDIGGYLAEGLPNITGSAYVRGFANDSNHCVQRFGSGALYEAARMASDVMADGITGGTAITMAVDASRSSAIYGNSSHVTPESMTVVMGVYAFGAVGKIGEATEAGIVEDLHIIKSSIFPEGTRMLFNQSAAPTGWVKQTDIDDVAIRIVSGDTGGSIGGSMAFSSAFAASRSINLSGSVGATTLTIAQMPSHSHTLPGSGGSGSAGSARRGANTDAPYTSSATGGSGSHTHTLSGTATLNLNVKYTDVIICAKG